MPSTNDFYDTLRERAECDDDFRASLLALAAEALVSGDLDEGKATLRVYIKSTIGYKAMADLTGVHPKSLIRMLGPGGNPRAENIVALLEQALRIEDIRLEVTVTNRPLTGASV